MSLFGATVYSYFQVEKTALKQSGKGVKDFQVTVLGCIKLAENAKWSHFLIRLLQFILALMLGGLLLSEIEGWIFSDGVYFAFQTATTIGYHHDQESLFTVLLYV